MAATTARGPEPSQPTPAPHRGALRNVVRTVLVAVLVLDVFVGGVVALNLRRSYEQREAQAALSAQSLARLLERSLEAVFDRVDLALLAVADVHLGQLFDGRPDPGALDEALAHQKARMTDILSLRIVDREGRVIRGVPETSESPSVLDRDYFVAQRDAPETGLFISRPAMGRIIKVPLVFLSRRLSRQIGRAHV